MSRFISKAPLFGFAVTLVALCVIAALSYRNIEELADHDRWVAHTHEVLVELEGLLSVVKDAMIGQRAYLITGEAKFLEPYKSARESINRREARLAALVSDNPAQAVSLRVLRERIETVLARLESNLKRFEAQGFPAAQEAVRQGLSTEAMDAVRATTATMQNVEQKLLDERTLVAQQGYDRAVDMLLASTAIGLAISAAGFELLRRDLSSREAAAEVVRRARDSLEIRVRERTAELAETNRSLEAEVAERQRAQDKLEQFTERLQQSNRELQEFASIASHDLQEPLRKIQAFGDRLQTMSASQLGEEGLDFLTRMQHAAGRMRKLIDDLLTFSRLTTRAQAFEPVDLNVVVREVLVDLETRLTQTGGRVEVAPLPVLQADAMQMRQLVQNLVGNALKFHKPGQPPTVKISAQGAPSVAGLRQGYVSSNGHQPAAFEIRFEDDGIGFDPKYLDRIFNVFQRLHGRNEFEGTGMGLAICRKIVERHHGRITAQSQLGQGATFIVTLPAEQLPDGGPTRESFAEADHDSHGG